MVYSLSPCTYTVPSVPELLQFFHYYLQLFPHFPEIETVLSPVTVQVESALT